MEFLIIVLLSCCIFLSQFTSSSDNHVQPKPSPLGCTITPSDAFIFTCPQTTECNTFAILRTNQYYSSLFNLSHYLNIDRHLISTTNGFSSETEFLIPNTPLLIPITCKCSSSSSPFHADLVRTAIAGETLYTISSSLEGLTTCASIAKKNPFLSPIHPVGDRARVSVPLRCACPSNSEFQSGTKLLIAYPVRETDSVSTLALEFNSTTEAIVSVNKNKSAAVTNGYYKFNPQNLVPGSTILIPLSEKPLLGSLAKPQQPWLRFPPTATSSSTNQNHTTTTTNHIHPSNKKKPRMSKANRICLTVIAIITVIFSITISVVVVVLSRRKDKATMNKGKKRNNNNSTKKNVMINEDVELRNLSIRTTSEKKVSFEGSTFVDGQMTSDTTTTTPHKPPLEIYTLTELVRATDNFNDHNHVDGTVYHGRLKGKDVAIKRTTSDVVAKVDYGLFHDSGYSHHPNIIRLMGSCLVENHVVDNNDNDNSFLVFEYANNGSLKDWVHAGLAVKTHFIASCYCFLNWKQRLKICLDVGLGLRYMHEIVTPPYVHRNLKSRNVFLDEEFNGKIGNFGMARCGGHIRKTDYEGLFCSSDPESWNRGYLAPELVKHGVTSTATDVFAFGVVLLEVLTGKTPLINTYDSDDGGQQKEVTILLADRVTKAVNDDDKLREWMDSALGENYRWEEAVKLLRIATGCVDEDPSIRPTAGEIVEELSRMVVDKDEEEAVNGIETEEECNLMHESSSKPLVMGRILMSN